MREPVTLYHFTSPGHVLGCRVGGITRGMLPVRDRPPQLRRGFQWLTTNPEKSQSWNEGSTLRYDRTAYRLTVVIPATRTINLLRWIEWGPRLSRIYDVLSEFGDPENWWLYHGSILPHWIVAVDDMRPEAAHA